MREHAEEERRRAEHLDEPRVASLGDLRFALQCIRRQVVSGSGKNRQAEETVLWERADPIPPEKTEATAGLTVIPILFAIPTGLPATDLDRPERQILWRLTIWAEPPGVDLRTTFHVPVFPV